MTWTPWQFIAVAVAGWRNRQQRDVIGYLREENRVLREKLGRKRIIVNDGQKRCLGRAAAGVGRALPGDVSLVLSPNTLLRRHGWLIARKHDGIAWVTAAGWPGGCPAR